MVTSRMLHYAQFLQRFNYALKYISTSEHSNANASSHLPLHVTNYEDSIPTYQFDLFVKF